jgi:hypothetical protein
LLLAATFFVCDFTTNGLVGTHMIALCDDHGLEAVAAGGQHGVVSGPLCYRGLCRGSGCLPGPGHSKQARTRLIHACVNRRMGEVETGQAG